MDYYLIYKNQPSGQLLIGTDNSFGVFWADQGFDAITSIISKTPERLEDVEIRTSQNKVLTVSEFLEKISKLKLRVVDKYL